MTKSEKVSDIQQLPKWVTDHFRELLESHEQLIQVITISERGISGLRAMPKIVKVLAEVDQTMDAAETKSRLQRAEKEAALAVREVESNFPVLHGLAVVALWSWLEHAVKGFLVLWLLNKREALDCLPIQRMRVKLGDYLRLGKREQAYFLVELLEQELSSSMKRGTARFDSLLEPFGFSLNLPSQDAKALFELQQVRNVIAHRNGKADARFRRECPWLKMRLNQSIRIDRK